MKKNSDLRTLGGLLLATLLTVNIVYADRVYRVGASDNLNRIVNNYYPDSDLSKSQIMVGILAKNPQAFKGGNINFLLRGKRLNLPDEGEISRISNEDAKELLAQHAKFFRRGVTGNLASPVFVEKSSTPDVLAASQKEQTKKISQLEKESSELKRKLEKLFEEKKARDEKLLELESSIKKSLTPPVPVKNDSTDTAFQLEQKNKRLEETNNILQQKLQESRSELAENTRSNISLERRVKNLQAKNNQAPDPIRSSHQTIQKNPASTPMESNKDSWRKLIWVLPLLLLAALWFLIRRFRSSKNKALSDNIDYASQIADAEAYNYLQQDDDIDYEEDSLATSIKLDVARAYVEADDTESALDILREIIEEGSDEQRKEAQGILAGI